MKTIAATALLGLSALLGSAGAVQAQYYNPYGSSYQRWNQRFPGYDGGSSIYRRQVRDMNPYGVPYRNYQRETRSFRSWNGF